MKYFIVTYYQYDNYGTRLQNYALKKSLEKLNVDVNTIYLKDCKKKIEEIVKDFVSIFPNFCSKQRIWKGNRKKKSKFKNFNSNLAFYKLKIKNLDKLDVKNNKFIVGSDQVWSPKHLISVRNAKELYFLNFAKNASCFSYAPSFGSSNIPKELENEYKTGLKKFDMISVREDAGKEILNQLGYSNVEIMPDPVFLLEKNEWYKLIENISININKKYILTYFLGKIDQRRDSDIKEYAKKNGYEIVNICGNYYNNKDFLASPEEFLKLIACSEMVFTDSFHASAFSIIFNKMFFVVKRNDVKQFSRLETLLRKYDMKDRILDENVSFNNIEVTEFENKNVVEKLCEEKNIGINYLKKIIDYEKKGNDV